MLSVNNIIMLDNLLSVILVTNLLWEDVLMLLGSVIMKITFVVLIANSISIQSSMTMVKSGSNLKTGSHIVSLAT